ncbi:CHAP domain-containing protein [Aciditerrimonas ferrireducens]|uniref:CHAP domain-containing protein n=1 Tax=Aciditerrimonas ferrireducens TaxID=667306 RepID=UPI002002AB39|nr:CHAP domain-containing protein [Aciditerrimonas ferrireducens]MCK4177784.1 CHAP domain-containing protein [Aciditerrimonas ferrireducens]
MNYPIDGRSRQDRDRRLRARRRRGRLGVLVALGGSVAGLAFAGVGPFAGGPTTLRQRIVALAESQVGYRTDPPDSYCNRYSASWGAGSTDCPGGLRAEEWCADFAAWVWWRAGAEVAYGDGPGELNGAAASFVAWGEAHGTWHPLGTGYRPEPGDVAVYGYDPATGTAVHVAIVVADPDGPRFPDVVNGDGDSTGFSVVERGSRQFWADTTAGTVIGPLSGYVAPTPRPAQPRRTTTGQSSAA